MKKSFPTLILILLCCLAPKLTAQKIVLKVKGETYREILTAGTTVKLPDADEMNRLCAGKADWSFEGWTEQSEIQHPTVAPPCISETPMPESSDLVLNAVYAYREKSGIYIDFPNTSQGVEIKSSKADTIWHIYEDDYVLLPQVNLQKVKCVSVTMKKHGTKSNNIQLRIGYGESNTLWSLKPLSDTGINTSDVTVNGTVEVPDGLHSMTLKASGTDISNKKGVEIKKAEVIYQPLYSITPECITNVVTKISSTESLHIKASDVTINSLVIESDIAGNTGQIIHAGHMKISDSITFRAAINNNREYCFGLPFNCLADDVILVDDDGNILEYGKDWTIAFYSHKRCGASNDISSGWIVATEKTDIQSNIGYKVQVKGENSTATLACTSRHEQEYDARNTVTMTNSYNNDGWSDDNSTNYAYKGWNLITIPQLNAIIDGELLQGDKPIQFVSIPNTDGITYTQTTIDDALNRGLLNPFTSFFVQLGSNETLGFASRLSQKTSEEITANEIDNMLELSVSNSEDKQDRCVITTNDNSTFDYEIGVDLTKFIGYGNIPQIYTDIDDVKYAFNSVISDECITVPVGIYAPVRDIYTIKALAVGMNNYEVIHLIDNTTGTKHNLKQGTYQVELAAGEHADRFQLYISKKGTSVSNHQADNTPYVYTRNGVLKIERLPYCSTVYICTSSGHVIYQNHFETENLEYHLPYKGVYIIKIIPRNGKTKSVKTIW